MLTYLSTFLPVFSPHSHCTQSTCFGAGRFVVKALILSPSDLAPTGGNAVFIVEDSVDYLEGRICREMVDLVDTMTLFSAFAYPTQELARLNRGGCCAKTK